MLVILDILWRKQPESWNRDMNYHLEQAGVQDLELAAPLFNDYRVFYGQQPDLAGAHQFLEARMDNKESVLFIAVTGEGAYRQAGGFAQLYTSFSSVTMQRVWILNDLFVAAEQRGKGLGSLLLTGVREFARNTGAKGLELTTMTNNTGAQRLYEAHGYSREDEFFSYHLFF
ncbi:GNAT family N-acetyltransferase [Paenibacillus riograndensis]|uniref:GNAT family N-acetyltransferase n=1 Tax=Paenibacillus riograndensis TaxID=483937 RepID=UPI000A8FED03